MGAPLFVEVRLPGFGTVSARHTQVPGARIDGVLEATRVDSGGVRHTLLAIVRGLSRAQVDHLAADLTATYGEPAHVLDGAPAREWFLRYSIAIRDLQSPAVRAMARFQRAMAVPWIRAEAGEMMLFAQAKGLEQAERAVERVHDYLAEYGVPGHAVVRTPTADDLETQARLAALLATMAWGADASADGPLAKA